MKSMYKEREFVCLGCGKRIKKRTSLENTKYCSLFCYRNSKRPNRLTGSNIICDYCGKKIYKQKVFLKKNRNNFCSKICANKFQGRNKLKFTCKICGKEFVWSKSRIKQSKPTYCSIKCRNKDKNRIQEICIQGNLIQQRNKGLNKIEFEGRKLLIKCGLVKDVDFGEQVLMFDKFLVDVLIFKKNIIIQWDGTYWHNKPKRKNLDRSQDAYLTKCGYKVLRFTDIQIKNEEDAVCISIRKENMESL